MWQQLKTPLLAYTGVVTIRTTVEGIYWSGDTGAGVVTIRDTVAGLHWCGDTGTGVTTIRDIVAGLHWCGDNKDHCCKHILVW